jgi:hypothetical protein
LPWFNVKLKRLCKKKNRRFKKAKKSGKAKDWLEYTTHKKITEKALRASRWDYVNSILQAGLEKGNTKPFWKYIKAQRQDNIGIAPLKSNGTLFTDSKSKSEILNQQFKSVFTNDDNADPPTLPGTPFPPIRPLSISVHGVYKLLDNINIPKAAGPDQVPGRLLQCMASELAPIFHYIFDQSLSTGNLPADWTQANVAPIFKKGSKHLAANYRPVSITCITCKLFEHIVCKHIMDHVETHNILSDLQHGFRSGRSCESQLITTIQDIASSFDTKKQIDIAILDFSKAFDTVPHNGLLSKLQHYGIDGKITIWISNFLKNRTQRDIVDGESCSPVTVYSGVPQGTVLGPILFLLHIHDLPSVVTSKVRLFADDCLLYREIDNANDQFVLQEDLKSLENWGTKWGMRFNATKCHIMQVSRKRNPLHTFYSLSGQILKEVREAQYLGVTIDSNIDWTKHISSLASKANAKLAFLQRNLKGCPQKLKEIAYFSLVRSQIEYSSSVWNPHQKGNIAKLERVQRKAARFVKGNYSYTESVTEMLQALKWQTLAHRRENMRLTLFYKIVNGLVAVPTESILIPADGRTRANHNLKFRHIQANCQAYKQSFFPATIKVWNGLSSDLIEAPSLTSFKNQLVKL